MIKIIDTLGEIESIFENGTFCMEKWEQYINGIYDNSANVFKKDSNIYFGEKNTFETELLPILNGVFKNPTLELLHNSFVTVTDNLNERVIKGFGKELDVEIVLYLGLGNGAGWVTNINGKDTILLGIEKIVELNWQNPDTMRGLIYHELGHVYHKKFGRFYQKCKGTKRKFVWQLFTEGIAMYFEQVLVGDFSYYHQDIAGWKIWCDVNFKQILRDFYSDLQTVNRRNQRYFGDWVKYCGHSDVGYYLGTRFVHYLMNTYDFDELIVFDSDRVFDLYLKFYEEEMHETSERQKLIKKL